MKTLNVPKYCLPLAIVIVLATGTGAFAQVIFGERGFQPNRPVASELPFEHIDTLTGNVLLTFTDLVLPGNGGFDLRIQRTYNSKIFRDYQVYGSMLDEDSWAGIGWTFHMGRVFHVGPNDTQDPIIEMPDGSRHRAYFQTNQPAWCQGGCFITREYWIFSKTNGTLQLPNGVVYTFGHYAWEDTGEGTAYYATQITDPFNNTIAIEYQPGPGPADGIQRITQNLGGGQSRQVTFGVGGPAGGSANSLVSMTYGNRVWSYGQVLTPQVGTSLLTSVTPPVGSGWSYSYNTTTFPQYEMTSLTTPNGGVISYQYADQDFYLGTFMILRTRVVTRRTTGGRGITAGVWTYAYAQGSDGNQTTITGPCTVTTYEFIGVGRNSFVGNTWSIGLPARRTISAGGTVLDVQDWTWIPGEPVSPDSESIGANYSEDINVPLLSQRVITRGSDTLTTVQSYASGNFNDYGRPNHTTETGNRGDVRSTTRVFQYGFTDYIVDRVQSETVSVGTGAPSFVRTNGYDMSTGFQTSETIYGVPTTFAKTAFGGNIASRTDANGHTTSFTYNWGVQATIQTPEYTVSRQINSDGTTASETRRGFTTYFQYDALMRPTVVTPPVSNATTTTYDSQGTFVRVSRGSSFVRTDLDGFGRVDGSENAAGVKTDRQYDACGNLSFDSYPYTTLDIGTSFAYDGLGRIVRRTNPDQPSPSFSTMTYSGLDVTVTDEEGRKTTRQFNSFGNPDEVRLTAVMLGDGIQPQPKTQYTYNPVGSLETVTQPISSGFRRWVYNTKNQLASEVHPENGTTTYSYDAAGNLAGRIDARGQAVTFGYDGNNRLVSIGYAGHAADNVTFAYDASDNRTGMSNGAVSTTFTYDAANRLTSRVDVVGTQTFTTGYAYDADDNVTKIDYPSGRGAVYTYDLANRVATVKDGANHNYATAFSYHPSGAIAAFTAGNGLIQSFSYDRRYRPLGITSGPLQATYGYDGVGNITSITDARPGFSQTFSYDDLDRLTTVNGFGQSSYDYDALGNRTGKHNAIGFVGYSYGVDQRLSQSNGYENAAYAYDGNGNTTGDGSGTYTYSPDDMMRTATIAGHTTSFAYDPDKLRVTKSVDGTTTYFVHGQSERLLSEFEASALKPFGWVRDYVYAGDRLIAGASCQFAVTPPTVAFANTGGNATVTVTTGAGCAWAATSDAAWATITSAASGSNSGNVSYSVAVNSTGLARSATLTIGGVPFALTQAAAACTVNISPSSAAPGSGSSSGSVTVTAPVGCPWSATSDSAWLTITAGSSGLGNGSVSYNVAANTGGPGRTGTLTIGGLAFVLTQAGQGCSFAISPSSASYGTGESTGVVSLTTAPGCTWSGTSDSAWLSITSNTSGTGSATVPYRALANATGPTRTGTLTIGGQAFVVTQTGLGCSYSVAPGSASIGSGGGSGSVALTSAAGCTWSASSNAAWLTITSGASGTGNGSVGYTAAANGGGSSRQGTLTIGGQAFVVTEAGAGCSYSVSPASASYATGGGAGSVSLTTAAGCTWSVSSNAAWLTITSGASGTGNGSVSYSVAANTSGPSRTGTLTFAGQTLTVTQSGVGCTSTRSPASASYASGGGSGTVSLTIAPGCTWTASSTVGWLTITSGASGTGSGSTGYSVAANGSSFARSGSLNISGQTVSITQAGSACSYSLSPAAASVSAAGGSGTASVVASPADCSWSAVSNTGWIAITGGSSGSGPGTVGYTAQANGTTSARAGTLTIAGQTFTLNQAGAVSLPLMNVDTPSPNATGGPPFILAGWAIDRASTTDTGVNAIHVWAYPNPGSGQDPVFVGVASYGIARPDLGALYGARFTNSGFSFVMPGMAAGPYQFVAYAYSTVTGTFNNSFSVTVTISSPNPLVTIDTPAANTTVGQSFVIAGWAVDTAAAMGTGIDALHVYASPVNGDPPIFLGAATYGGSRPDVGAALGDNRFTPSGFGVAVNGLAPGTYLLIVYPHSTVSGAFGPASTVSVTVQ